MRARLLVPILAVAALMAACSEHPVAPALPDADLDAPVFAKVPAPGSGVCPNVVWYYMPQVRFTFVSANSVFGHLGPRTLSATGIQEFGLALDATMIANLKTSEMGGCTADVQWYAQGYLLASGAANSRFASLTRVRTHRPGGGSKIRAEVRDSAFAPPFPAACPAGATACTIQYAHLGSIFPILKKPLPGDSVVLLARNSAFSHVTGNTVFDNAGAQYNLYATGPSAPRLYITLP